MNDHAAAIPAWNLGLRFVLELAAFTGFAWAGWHLADGFLAVVLTLALPFAAAALWGVFNVPGDPSRSGKAPVPVPGWLRLLVELVVLVGGAASFAFFDAPWIGAILGALIVIHLAFSMNRTRWLVQQR
jgi:hypothetical protein